MASVFSKIISKEIPCHKIAETDTCIAFLDIFPIQKGHLLVIPKKEVNNLFNLDNETYTSLMFFTKKVAKALEKTILCAKVGVSVIGLEVPHAHIHLIPINSIDDMNFNTEKLKFSSDEFNQMAKEIASNYNKLTI